MHIHTTSSLLLLLKHKKKKNHSKKTQIFKRKRIKRKNKNETKNLKQGVFFGGGDVYKILFISVFDVLAYSFHDSVAVYVFVAAVNIALV
jgi:hypothetical protein